MKQQFKVTNYVLNAATNGLNKNDIRGYKYLSPKDKHAAISRVTKLLKSMRVGKHHVQTSIIPKNLIVKIWKREYIYQSYNYAKLITKTCFDDGTVFHIEDRHNRGFTNES